MSLSIHRPTVRLDWPDSISPLLIGRFGISPEMSIRLSKAFGGSAESWLIQQAQYDLWQAMQKADRIEVKALVSQFTSTMS